MSLNQKVILITGAARRLGRALALNLAEEGSAIALHYRSSQKDAKNLLELLEKKGARAALFKADLRKVRQIEAMVQKVIKHFGHIDVLINNASIFFATPFGKIREKEWDLFIETNLKGPFFCTQAVCRYLGKKKRRSDMKIINILDSSGPKTRGNYLPYWISKSGFSAMTETLARIFSPMNKGTSISVNAIAPGPILFPKDREKFKDDITINPSDIVSAVKYLIEDKHAVTGNVLVIDKGRRYLS
jgi:pteridine reductase